jgi:tRNA U34 2-thiouridine synthase MnmA/TrmU
MSGGTDSSVAAMRLQDAGYEVTGVTFRFYEKDGATEIWMMPVPWLRGWNRTYYL